MDRGERTRRGRKAAELLGDDILAEAFASARLHFMQNSLYLPSVDEREQARASALALERVMAELQAIVGDGQMAEEALRREA